MDQETKEYYEKLNADIASREIFIAQQDKLLADCKELSKKIAMLLGSDYENYVSEYTEDEYKNMMNDIEVTLQENKTQY
jgi:hypothetical protein